MFRSYRVGTLFGIPFRLDITFLLILPVFAWLLGGQLGTAVTALEDLFGVGIDAEAVTAGRRPWLLGLVAALALFACVTLHELGHAVVAQALGYEMESITLWLLGGLAKPAELPRDWLDEFWIAVAGPAVNLVIAGGCLLVVAVVPVGDVFLFLLLYLAVLNVALAVFNMLPVFPLDGGRVLRALLARTRPYARATRQAAAVGKAGAVVLGLLGLLAFNPILIAIALFVYVAATAETRQMLLDAAFEGVHVESVMTPAAQLETVEADTTVEALLDRMLASRHLGYPVLDDDTFVGVVTLEDVQSTALTAGVVEAVMTPRSELETVHPDTEVREAFELLDTSGVGRLPVVDEHGTLVGIVTRTDLVRSFRIAAERERFDRRDRDTSPARTVD